MKFVCILLFSSLLATAFAAPQQTKNIVTEIIEQLIEKNREKMANISVPLINLTQFGSVNDLLISGVDAIQVVTLEDCGALTLDVCNMTVALATGSAICNFEFNNIQVPEIGVSLNGKGDLTGSANDMWVTVKLNLKLKGLGIELVDFSGLKIIVKKITAYLTGIDNQEQTNNILSRDLALYLTTQLATIATNNKEAVIAAINAILEGLI